MKRGRWLVFGLLGLVLAVGMAGCKITSASPNPNTIMEMKPGDKVVFKVGPVTPTTRCVWTISNSETYEVVSEGKNEFELDFNPDSKLSNKKNIITCAYQSYRLVWHCDEQLGGCGPEMDWVTTDSRSWEVRTNPNSDTIITGYYIIEDDSDLQLLKGYTTVTGSLIIGPSIESLEGLESLTTIGSDLYISDNDALTSLAGLENLTSVVGDLYIWGNDALTSLSGLEKISSVGGDLHIGSNDALTNLSGLENLTSVGGDLDLGTVYGGNTALTSLSALGNLISIGGYLEIEECSTLTSLSGLEKLTLVGGLYINWNPVLKSLTGLENITSIGEDLRILENPALTSLSGLENITTVGGDLIINDNAVLTILGMAGLQRVDGNFWIEDNPLLCKSLAEELRDQVLAGGGIGGGRYIGGNKECTTP